MQSAKKGLRNEALAASTSGLRFVVEPEPWLRIFARNIGDLFRKAPPPVWVSSAPGEYWPDALVHRPVAWKAARQSFLGHALAIVGDLRSESGLAEPAAGVAANAAEPDGSAL